VIVPLFEVVTLSVALVPVVEVGLRVAVAPVGRPVTLRVIGRVKHVRAMDTA
jgi:hypothetical protein